MFSQYGVVSFVSGVALGWNLFGGLDRDDRDVVRCVKCDVDVSDSTAVSEPRIGSMPLGSSVTTSVSLNIRGPQSHVKCCSTSWANAAIKHFDFLARDPGVRGNVISHCMRAHDRYVGATVNAPTDGSVVDGAGHDW